MTSLRDTCCYAERRADELRQIWSHPAKINKVLILIEGSDDEVFYKNLFDSNTSDLQKDNGCGKIKRIHECIASSNRIKHFLLIKDADFDRLLGETSQLNKHYFLTDFHDLEVSFVLIPAVLESYLSELRLRFSEEQFSNPIYGELETLSLYKFLNYRDRRMVRFKKPELTVKTTDEITSIEHLLECYKPKDKPCITKQELQDFINQNRSCCKLQITNGHDFIFRLTYMLKTIHNKQLKNINPKEIEKQLRLKAITLETFKHSNLYAELFEWQNQNEKTILL